MGAGRPTFEREKELLRIVLDLLPADGQPVRWRELLQEARMRRLSPTTLSKKLSELQATGAVTRAVDGNKKPPEVTYSRMKEPDVGPGAQPSSMQLMLHWLKEKGHDVDRFIYASTLWDLVFLMCYVTMTIYDAFGLPRFGETNMRKRSRPPKWIADKLNDVYVRPRMQSLIDFLNMKDPRTNTPIYQNPEVLKAVRRAEKVAGSMLSESETKFLGPLNEAFFYYRRPDLKRKLEERAQSQSGMKTSVN